MEYALDWLAGIWLPVNGNLSRNLAVIVGMASEGFFWGDLCQVDFLYDPGELLGSGSCRPRDDNNLMDAAWENAQIIL